MARVKTDFRNCLGRTRLDARLEVSEEGVELAEFKPDPAIDIWYSTKVRRVTWSPHIYPNSRKRQKKPDKALDIATVTLSDFENSEEEEIQ